MRQRSPRILVYALLLAVLLSLLPALVGCGGDNGGGAAAAMMEKLPKGSDDFMYVDLKALRADQDLKSLADALAGDPEGMTEMFGIDAEDADALAYSGDNSILEGSFDLQNARDAMKDAGFEEKKYQDVEVWEMFGMAVALVGQDCIIFGESTDIEGCIDAIKGKADSLHDDKDAVDDVSRLPDGFMVGWGTNVEDLFGAGEYAGLKAVALSFSKKDAQHLHATYVLRFEDDAAAKDAADDVDDDLKEQQDIEVSNLKVEQDGKYIKVSGDMPVEDAPFL